MMWMNDELGLKVTDNTSPTYTKCDSNEDDQITADHLKFMQDQFSIKSSSNVLPKMYWIPKMHKDPPGARFIIASKQCSTKKISKSVSSAYKLIFQQMVLPAGGKPTTSAFGG